MWQFLNACSVNTTEIKLKKSCSDCIIVSREREEGVETPCQTLTKQSSLSQNNDIKKNRLKPKENYN